MNEDQQKPTVFCSTSTTTKEWWIWRLYNMLFLSFVITSFMLPSVLLLGWLLAGSHAHHCLALLMFCYKSSKTGIQWWDISVSLLKSSTSKEQQHKQHNKPGDRTALAKA